MFCNLEKEFDELHAFSQVRFSAHLGHHPQGLLVHQVAELVQVLITKPEHHSSINQLFPISEQYTIHIYQLIILNINIT